MKFMHSEYLPVVIIVFCIFSFFVFKESKKFFSWVKTFWFFERSSKNKISTYLYLGSFLLLGLSLLDLRGAETKIKASIPDQKTIVIIDSSASMLVEDVRPNRYRKAILMARHFVKKAVGHQVAVVLFSDTQKRLVPFTDDLDLLDSRLAALETLNISRGGSNISQAIMESVQYFKMDGAEDDKEIGGNILVFTDSEEGDDSLQLKIPSNVNLAMVGVGTLKGGPIPIRNRKGTLNGYKKHNREKVVSKLNENLLKSFGSNVNNFKYWIAQSYTIPTEQILSFFRKIHKKKLSKGDVKIRPVAAKYLLIPFIVLYILSIAFGRTRSFAINSVIVFLLFSFSSPVEAQEVKKKLSPEQVQKLKAKKEREDQIFKGLKELKNGNLNKEGRLKLAEDFLLNGDFKRSNSMYNETIDNWDDEEIKPLINMGTSYLFSGNIKEGTRIYNFLKNERNLSPNQRELLRQNLLKALKKKKEDKKTQDKKNKENKEQKENKDKKESKKKNGQENKDKKDNEKNKKQGQGEGQDQKNKDQKNKKNKKKNQNKSGDGEKKKDKKEESEKKEKKDKKSESGEASKKDKKDKEKKKQKSQTLEQKEAELRKRRKMVKIPASVKQIMSEDRALQKRYIDTTNRKKRNNRSRKDW